MNLDLSAKSVVNVNLQTEKLRLESVNYRLQLLSIGLQIKTLINKSLTI